MARLVLGAALVVALALQQPTAGSRPPRIQQPVPWATSGVWLNAETHAHTRFSDGNHAVDAVVDRAVANGCDVIAITDHIDGGLGAATPEYHAAIASARARWPQVVLLTGFEWNVPPGKGQDHAVVFSPRALLDDAATWGEFKTRFDDYDKQGENPELAAAAFDWLRARGVGADAPVVFLNHPSRRAADVEAVARQLSALASIGHGIFVGAEGAPGHQQSTRLGAYGGRLKPSDRWDPAVAEPGGAWDQRLLAGERLWGALATADFHEERGDYWPCEFSVTSIHAPDRTVEGVLAALRAGTFVGVHGGIARDVRFTASAQGLPRAAIAGETIGVAPETTLTLELRATVPETDWARLPNRIDEAEFIVVGPGGVTSARVPWTGTAVKHALTVPAGRLAVRARARRVIDDGPDLLLYTNPVFIDSSSAVRAAPQ